MNEDMSYLVAVFGTLLVSTMLGQWEEVLNAARTGGEPSKG